MQFRATFIVASDFLLVSKIAFGGANCVVRGRFFVVCDSKVAVLGFCPFQQSCVFLGFLLSPPFSRGSKRAVSSTLRSAGLGRFCIRGVFAGNHHIYRRFGPANLRKRFES